MKLAYIAATHSKLPAFDTSHRYTCLDKALTVKWQLAFIAQEFDEQSLSAVYSDRVVMFLIHDRTLVQNLIRNENLSHPIITDFRRVPARCQVTGIRDHIRQAIVVESTEQCDDTMGIPMRDNRVFRNVFLFGKHTVSQPEQTAGGNLLFNEIVRAKAGKALLS